MEVVDKIKKGEADTARPDRIVRMQVAADANNNDRLAATLFLA